MAKREISNDIKKSLAYAERKAIIPESMSEPAEPAVPVVVGVGADSPKQIPNDQD